MEVESKATLEQEQQQPLSLEEWASNFFYQRQHLQVRHKDSGVLLDAMVSLLAKRKKERPAEVAEEKFKFTTMGALEVAFDLSYADSEEVWTNLNARCHEGESRSSNQGHRGPSIVDGLDTALSHKLDLKEFETRIDSLFAWYGSTAQQKKYVAPYFCFVQSSGMGKTKILTEYRKAIRNKSDRGRRVITILCVDAQLPEEEQAKYYDHRFDTRSSQSAPIVEQVFAILDGLVSQSAPSAKTEIVLLFDEAQGLMEGTDSDGKGSLVFRAVRWWLRACRNEKVVAVFAGTTAKLSNFYPPDPPARGVSRNEEVTYVNFKAGEDDMKELYPPFFLLHTIGCLNGSTDATTTATQKDDARDPGFRSALIYGRPLFAYYHLKGELNESKTRQFAARMVLSSRNYEQDTRACFSVLGVRVQMGLVSSFDTLSELVSSGYACLVDFQQQSQQRLYSTYPPLARVAFMPDPLCATLAMRFMDESWELRGLKGRSRSFWVTKAQTAFNTKLCLPEKGDVGEVFAALFMLFCGDILRKKKDASLSTFAVSLTEWFRLLKRGGNDQIEGSGVDQDEACSVSLATETKGFLARVTRRAASEDNTVTEPSNATCTVSFVQVCRNDFRANSFCKRGVLRHMYRSGLATYAYKNCKAIDIASSIRAVENSMTSYHPLLVSIKNWAKVSKSDVVGWLSTMMSFLSDMDVEGGGRPPALCLIILLGCPNPPEMNQDQLNSEDLKPFPSKDVFRLVCVPEEDAFGVSVAIKGLGATSEKQEIYASHGLLACEEGPDGLLRKNSANVGYVNGLFEALSLKNE